ncbi:hypothetical protein BJ170DRAFT_347830 [Xylariales sp. AK1849]|nr:hypothetical protein BJ170DRAFT_347830 [Xylariales sp. AK1849]
MPRPKRTRVASTRTAAPVAKAKDPSPPPAPDQASDSTDIYDVSDRETERARLIRESKSSTSLATSVTNPRQAAALEASRQRRDSAMKRLEDVTPTSAANINTGDDDSEGSSIEVEVGRRAAATPAHGRAAEMSGLDLDDDMFDDLNTTFDTAGPASAQRSHDTSTLSASNFHRRPRAGSFLSRDDGPLRPSSRAGPNTPGISSTFNIGVFKRRAREPSILGTAQKPRAERPVPQSDSGDKTDDEADEEQVEGDEIAPEVESTPPLTDVTRRSGAAEAGTVSPQASSSANPRKRKSTEAHEQRPRSSSYDDIIPNTAEQSDAEAGSSAPSLPRMLSRPSTPLVDEDIAPPESSGSSQGEDEIWPPLQSLARGRAKRPVSALRRTPIRDDNLSDMSSPPSLTYSPNYGEPSPPPAKQTRRATSKPETKVTTADLTGLLPRRRHRNARNDPLALGDSEEEEVDASGLGDDDDELSYLDVRARRRPARPFSRAGTANRSATRGRSVQPKAKLMSPSARPARRTYGRSSDKENQDEEEGGSPGEPARDEDDATENSEELVARVGEELKNAARKFAEVDKWKLDYEEMTQSSSPRDAR